MPILCQIVVLSFRNHGSGIHRIAISVLMAISAEEIKRKRSTRLLRHIQDEENREICHAGWTSVCTVLLHEIKRRRKRMLTCYRHDFPVFIERNTLSPYSYEDGEVAGNTYDSHPLDNPLLF